MDCKLKTTGWCSCSSKNHQKLWFVLPLRKSFHFLLLTFYEYSVYNSLRKQPMFREVTTWALAKWRLSNELRNSILMTCHYPDLGSASDWLKENSLAAQPIKSNTKIWVVTRHQKLEFLHSLLRRRFARAQVATLPNISCFLRLCATGYRKKATGYRKKAHATGKGI